ncbi:FAD-dependent oxidoreductase [uncultured Desulfovibrio sp.]|uniref:FAD-dependent oxidoreductase n=1 Tax=uncultured Desulfovibrio sp. TaxID=167968 RepID=UPI0025D720FD|nr:FAD-dependent oxidoreductase [uncultured Desulfovibrio sp.]
MNVTNFDCIVIGAGPAGLAAACAARDCGLEVALLDEQAAPGGQLFRNVESPLAQRLLDEKDRRTGLDLVARFRAGGTDYRPHSTVWAIDGTAVSYSRNGVSERITASHIILAPGGMERPVPFPGWTLPGVMGAGGMDILLRSDCLPQLSRQEPVVLCGNGPLLLLLACHLLDAGAPVAAWLDTGDTLRRLAALPHMPAALGDRPYLAKGLRMARRVLSSGIPIIRNVRSLRAEGDGHVERVRYTDGKGEHSLPAGMLLRHEGIIPRTHIPNALGLAMTWDEVQRCWHPTTDIRGRTSCEHISIAGDSAYVHGGDASLLKGTLAGIDAARRLHVISEAEADHRSAGTLRELRRLEWARGFLRHIFAPHPDIFAVPDDTIICRCENVSAGDIRAAVREGFTNVNEIKRFTRCGMGPCQGRMCGPALAELAAQASGLPPRQVDMLHVRMPFRPVLLNEYCTLNGLGYEENHTA